jgi:hypothetical protein
LPNERLRAKRVTGDAGADGGGTISVLAAPDTALDGFLLSKEKARVMRLVILASSEVASLMYEPFAMESL